MATDPLVIEKITATGAWQSYEVPSYTKSIVLQARTAVDVQIGSDSTGTDYFTVKSGSPITIETPNLPGHTIYVKAAVSTVIEVLCLIM